MITRTFKLCLNAGTGSAPYINVSQYDEGETWLFELYSETGERYIPTTGAIVGVKSDGHGIANTGTVDSEGRVVIAETQQMTASAGRAIYELSIDGLTHGTANFIVAVERKPTDDAVMSDSDLSLIQEAIDSAEVIVEVIGDSDPSEVIGEHVDAWLDNHPEATTTVEDGAITAPKINNSLWDKILVNEEASGNPASFDDGADDVPVSSLKVALEPIQTGSGDPSPINIRPIIAANGKNMFDPSTLLSGYYADKDTNTLSGSTTNYRTAELALYQGTYTISFSNTVNIVRYREKGIVSNSNVATGVKSYTFTVSTNATVALGFRMPDVAWDDSTVIQIEHGSSATPYQPYQSVMVERTGVNQFDEIWESGSIASANGQNTDNASVIRGKNYIPVRPNTQYYLSNAYGSNIYWFFYGADKTYLNAYGNGNDITVTTPPNAYYMRIRWASGYGTTYRNDTVINYPSSVTTYEPFTGTSYPMSLGRAVYGGTVDLATGVLTVNKVAIPMESISWQWSESSHIAYAYIADKKPGRTNLWSEMYKTVDKGYADMVSGEITGAGNTGINVRDDRFTALADFVTAVTGLKLMYVLATPTTVQLTPTEVKTLLGYNNISSSGTVDVIYHADTKLYVDKMTNVDNNIIAPTEETFTATRNYTTNDLVIANGTLYKVTANIASGSAITPNSNVQQTTLSALIKALS